MAQMAAVANGKSGRCRLYIKHSQVRNRIPANQRRAQEGSARVGTLRAHGDAMNEVTGAPAQGARRVRGDEQVTASAVSPAPRSGGSGVVVGNARARHRRLA